MLISLVCMTCYVLGIGLARGLIPLIFDAVWCGGGGGGGGAAWRQRSGAASPVLAASPVDHLPRAALLPRRRWVFWLGCAAALSVSLGVGCGAGAGAGCVRAVPPRRCALLPHAGGRPSPHSPCPAPVPAEHAVNLEVL